MKKISKSHRAIRRCCAAFALALAMVVGLMTGIVPGMSMTAYAAMGSYTIEWDYETFRTMASGESRNGITFVGKKALANIYDAQTVVFTAPADSVFTQIEFATTSTNISANSANTGIFSVVAYDFYSSKDKRDRNGKKVTWTGNSNTVSFKKYAYAVEYITFTLYGECPGHTWEWVIDQEPTCGASGEKHEECSICGAIQSEGTAIDPTGEHTWEWVTDTEPTCGASGEKHEECSVCHATQSEGTAIDPTGEHTWEWVTDTEPTCAESGVKHEECTVCHTKQNEGTAVEPTGEHTWEWVTDTEPTETLPGKKHEECTVCHATQSENTEIPARGADDYSFTADSKFTWTKGSKDGLLMVIKNTSGDDSQTINKLVDVYVDGAKLTRDTDYTAESGSIKLTLSADYLSNLATGEHTVKVELTVTTLEHTFTVAAPASTDSPTTGESIALIVCSVLFMALAVCGAVYAVSRKRRTQA